MVQLTFNPGLTLTGFRTIRPRITTEQHTEIETEQQIIWG